MSSYQLESPEMPLTLQSHNAPDDGVNFANIHIWIILRYRIFGLVEGNASGDNQKHNAPET
jgi:hypothetical protein